MTTPRKKTDPKPAKKRPPGTYQAGQLIARIARKAIGKKGFTQASILLDWAEIIGPDLNRVAQPERLAFPKGQRNGGTLHIRTTSAMALQLQHLTPLLIERVNAHFGYGAVAAVRIHQGALTMNATQQKTAREARYTPVPLDAAQKADLEAMIEGTEDDDLKDRLKKLGAAVLSRKSATKGP